MMALLLCLCAGFLIASRFLGANRDFETPLPTGSLAVPHERTEAYMPSSGLTQELLEEWASKGLPDWKRDGKVLAPRVALAKLFLNRDVPQVNEYLAGKVPWGRPGSTWPLHPEGDYDFTLVPLTTLLYLLGDTPEILYPATREHLLSVLLCEEGGKTETGVPRTLGLIRDTENHILMREGSRYLKNRWLHLHGNREERFDNEKNGLEVWMLHYLRNLEEASLHEFNSMPYSGYTLTALLNIEAFASEPVRLAAKDLLDRLNWNYALGSLSYRRFPPMRRQLGYSRVTTLGQDYHTALIKVWMSLRPGTFPPTEMGRGGHHAILAALLPYRLPKETARWIEAKPSHYFVQIGHGPKASPEIYAGGPGYLLSAGGVHRGLLSHIVARPITLLIEDSAQDLSEVVHLAGPAPDFKRWNNTGVFGDFAVAAGPVSVPAGWTPICQQDGWSIYESLPGKTSPRLIIAVHSTSDFGLIAILHGQNPQQALESLRSANPDAAKLQTGFQWPGGARLEYDVLAPKSLWVMTRKDGQPLPREHEQWPLLEGTIETLSSAHADNVP